MYSISDVMFV